MPGRVASVVMGLAFITFGLVAGLNVRPLSGAHLSALILIAGGGFLIVRVIQVARGDR